MLDFPVVPRWWSAGAKHMRLKKGYSEPNYIIGYDTETFRGRILTQQFSSSVEDTCQWVTGENVLDKFLDYLEKFNGYVIMYCFNAKFDLALLLREYIDLFVQDKFTLDYRGWKIQVFCSRNWYASFNRDGTLVRFLDLHNFFAGSLDTVAKSFKLETAKHKAPDLLGHKKFTPKDRQFKEYAIHDARICYQIGKILCDMHGEFDVPIATSSANLAEKVFRRNFLREGDRIKFPPFSALRLAELSYHGGKNGYYLDNPTLVRDCYEYDFNAAYGYAMYSLPSFLEGTYRKVSRFYEDAVGVYQVHGRVKPCRFGILYNTHFQYFRFDSERRVTAFVTSFELKEALRSKEFVLESCAGWIWQPISRGGLRSPLSEYSGHFWKRKNKAQKGSVNYIFYKLLLNSLYGKWIQRNPGSTLKLYDKAGQLTLWQEKDVSGGLYQPFIATLITGMTRARLHREEHNLDAIESSTDSVKSRKFHSKYKANQFGRMELQSFKCKDCGKKTTKFDIVFIRNRLNLLMDKKGHILKATLHGFWGKPDLLKRLWKERAVDYTIDRFPHIKEGLIQPNKALFQMHTEERTLNIDWKTYEEIK